VTLLTTGNFRSLTSRETRGARVVLLEFFQNSCGACRELHAPMLAKLAEQLRGAALVAAVDCSPGAATEKICSAQKVAAFPTLRLLFEGGSADVPEAEVRSEGRLRNFVLARLPTQKVALTDGDGPASRRKLGDLARRCDAALTAAAAAGAAASGGGSGGGGGGGGGTGAGAGAGARSRGSLGCAVFFSDKKEPAPVWAALSLSAEFDSARPEAANASTVDDRKVTPLQLPGFVFVFAQTGKGEGGQGVRPGVAADLGVRALPAVVLLHGAALADFELRELKSADVARGGPKRRGEVEAIADTEGRVRGRRLLEPAAVAGGYDTLRAALLEHQRGVGLALRAAARLAAKRAQAAGVRPPSHEESSEAPPTVPIGDDGEL
jgi:thiol-disulfide isomerase/thioredoxin